MNRKVILGISGLTAVKSRIISINSVIFHRLCSIKSRQITQAEKLAHSFGYEEVTPSEKREKVQTVFTEVAAKYDLMNDVMSLGIHRYWKDYFIQTLCPTPGMKLLDVAGGTGDIAFRFLEASVEDSDKVQDFSSDVIQQEETMFEKESHVTVFDINDTMLSICQKKAKDAGLEQFLTCIQGNAESLPFKNDSFDAYTIAFGIRNVVHIDQALSEAFRVLRPGGRFLCLEFSQVMQPTLYRVYDWYSREIIPVLGQIVAGNWKAYQYLIESIQKFPNQEEFSIMIQEAGFKHINHKNMLSGIAAIHSGYKL